MKLFIIIIVFAFLAAGCKNEQPVQEIQNSTATPETKVDTSSTPEVKVEESAKVIGQNKVYSNAEYNFEFQYPKSFDDLTPAHSVNGDSVLLGVADSKNGSIAISVIIKLFDPKNIMGLYGKIDDAEKLTVGGRDWYLYHDGDAGCGGITALAALKNQTISLQFGSCEGDTKPYVAENQDLINAVLASVKIK